MANVTLSGVGKASGDAPVLHNVDLDIRDGEVLAFDRVEGSIKPGMVKTCTVLDDAGHASPPPSPLVAPFGCGSTRAGCGHSAR